MYITLDELKEMVRRMENSGANRIYVDACVNCDTAEIDEMHFDAMDNDLYLDTVYNYYIDDENRVHS